MPNSPDSIVPKPPSAHTPEGLETIRDFVRWAATRFEVAGLFYGHGTDNALDEALLLVLGALELDPSWPAEYRACRLTQAERAWLAELIARRIEKRVPAAYLTGRAWFAGLEFRVDPQVLVPRSPIAELIDNGFQPWLDPSRIARVLDLCCGSGCIGIASACYLPECSVDLADISAPALACAQTNLVRHGLEDRVELIESDLFSALGDRRYDLIVSNPPYVSPAEYAQLPREYHREPRLGLVGGTVDGLDLVARILAAASSHLEPDGVLIVEVGASAPALEARYPQVAFTWLAFERGGGGVFLLTREQLDEYREQFAAMRSV